MKQIVGHHPRGGVDTNDVVLNRGGGVFRWGGCAIGW